MADTIVNVPYAKQKEKWYCGPATLQMTLAALNVPSPATPPAWQDQLWAQVKAQTGGSLPAGQTMEDPTFITPVCEWCDVIGWRCWTTTPEVLIYLLNSQQTAAMYSIVTTDIKADATAVLLDTIDANLPAIALVRGWKHWLVVNGYKHDRPGANPIGSRNVNGLFLKDPNAPSKHYVTWNKWRSDYLKVVPCGDYEGEMVMVPAMRRGFQTVGASSQPSTMAPIILSPTPPGGTKPMTPFIQTDLVVKKAQDAARELSEDSDAMRIGFSNATESRPTLVQNLDSPDSYYYIVNFTRGGKETARVLVDAKSGEFQEAEVIDTNADELTRFLAPTALAERLIGDAERSAMKLPFRIRKELVGQHPVLVWRACMESSSPFLPFYQFSIGNSFVYYRVDGLFCERLTVAPA